MRCAALLVTANSVAAPASVTACRRLGKRIRGLLPRPHDALDLGAGEAELAGDRRRLDAGLEGGTDDPFLARRQRRRPAFRLGLWWRRLRLRGGIGRPAATACFVSYRMQQAIELAVVEMPQRGRQIGGQRVARRSIVRRSRR